MDKMYQKPTQGDDIDLMNKEALQNMQWQRSQKNMEPLAVYGEYRAPPLGADKKQAMEDALREIHQIITPTLKGLKHTANMVDLQERIYRKFAFYESELNQCIFASKNIRDTNYCADKFVNQLRGEGKQYVLDILKDY